MQETWFQSLAWEDPLEKGLATHSSILAGQRSKDISWTEERESNSHSHNSCEFQALQLYQDVRSVFPSLTYVAIHGESILE